MAVSHHHQFLDVSDAHVRPPWFLHTEKKEANSPAPSPSPVPAHLPSTGRCRTVVLISRASLYISLKLLWKPAVILSTSYITISSTRSFSFVALSSSLTCLISVALTSLTVSCFLQHWTLYLFLISACDKVQLVIWQDLGLPWTLSHYALLDASLSYITWPRDAFFTFHPESISHCQQIRVLTFGPLCAHHSFT